MESLVSVTAILGSSRNASAHWWGVSGEKGYVKTLVTAAKEAMVPNKQFVHVRRYLDTMFTLLWPTVYGSQKKKMKPKR